MVLGEVLPRSVPQTLQLIGTPQATATTIELLNYKLRASSQTWHSLTSSHVTMMWHYLVGSATLQVEREAHLTSVRRS
eukprot:816849-Amphidinium_carterae.1